MRARLISFFGSILSRYGIAGFVREGRYIGQNSGVIVNVRRSGLHSVVSVNDVAVYFHRVTGEIEGVKLQEATGTVGSDRVEIHVPDDAGVRVEQAWSPEDIGTPAARTN